MLVLLKGSFEESFQELLSKENGDSFAALKVFARITRAITKSVFISINFACLSYLCRSAWL